MKKCKSCPLLKCSCLFVTKKNREILRWIPGQQEKVELCGDIELTGENFQIPILREYLKETAMRSAE